MEEEGLTLPVLRNRNVNWGRLQESLNSDNGIPTATSQPTWVRNFLENEYGRNNEADDENDEDAFSFLVHHNDDALNWVNDWIRRPGNIIPIDASEISLADRAMERVAQTVQRDELMCRTPRDLIAQRDLLGLRHYIVEPITVDIQWEQLQRIKEMFIHRLHFECDVPVLEIHPVGATRHATIHVEVRTTEGDTCTQILLDNHPVIYWTASQECAPYLKEGYPITIEYDYLSMEKYYLDIFLRICRHLNLTLYLFRDSITLSRWPEREQRDDPFIEDYTAGIYHTYFMSDRVVNDYIFKEIRNERRRRASQKG